MSISEEDVAHVARLAQLELSGEETAGMVRDLNAVLEFVERLKTVATDDQEPGGEGPGRGTPLRPDRVETWLGPGEATAAAPEASDDLFRVPPVLGGGSGPA